MENTISNAQQVVIDILNSDIWFSDRGITWLKEDALDIEFQTKKSLNSTGIAAIVLTPELDYQGITSDGKYAFSTNAFTLQVIENPSINRTKPNASSNTVGTALETAHQALYTLGKTQTDKYFGCFTPMSIRQSTTAENKLLLVEARLGTTLIL